MLDITKEQFTELVITLEQRNLSIGLELSKNIDMDNITEVPQCIANKIDIFEDLQHKIYSQASDYNMQDMFEIEESVGKLIIKPDSELEQIVWSSIEETELAVTYEMIVRKYMIQEGQKIRDELGDDVNFAEIAPRINKLSKKIYNELYKNGLDNLDLKF